MSRRNLDRILDTLIWLSAFFSVAVLLGILGFVFYKGLGKISLHFLTASYKTDLSGGIWPMIVTTVYLVGLSLLFVTPLGIGAAIYLEEYAKEGKLTRLITFATESLAGIPSIIYGLFGMIFFTTVLGFGFSLLSGALTMMILLLPTMLRTTQEALRAIPREYKEASLALGASRLRTLFKVILPSALPGITTGMLLSIGRVVGETAAIYLPLGMYYEIPKSVFDSGRTLSVHLYLLAKEGISFEHAYATAAVLVVVVLLMNQLTKFFKSTMEVKK